MPRVVLLLTSASSFKGKPTGIWLEECAAPYYVFVEAGHDVQLVSCEGGEVPIDANSTADSMMTEFTKRFVADPDAQTKIKNSQALPALDASTVDAVFCVGGHGTLADFPENASVKELLETVYGKGGVVAAVCHGRAALVGVSDPATGKPLVDGKAVTAFTKAEEAMTEFNDLVDYHLEDKFKGLGGKFELRDPWSSHCVTDGKLVTGQNPQSSEATAKALLAALS